jgi:hypothetical protein
VHGILCLQDITMVRETLAMRCGAQFLEAVTGEDFHHNITFVTTKWDSLRQDRLETYRERHQNWQSSDLWQPFIEHGARTHQHYGVSNRGEENTNEDIQRAQESMLDIMQHYLTAPPARLELQNQFRTNNNDQEETLRWLILKLRELAPIQQQEEEEEEEEGRTKEPSWGRILTLTLAAGAVTGGYYANKLSRGKFRLRPDYNPETGLLGIAGYVNKSPEDPLLHSWAKDYARRRFGIEDNSFQYPSSNTSSFQHPSSNTSSFQYPSSNTSFPYLQGGPFGQGYMRGSFFQARPGGSYI